MTISKQLLIAGLLFGSLQSVVASNCSDDNSRLILNFADELEKSIDSKGISPILRNIVNENYSSYNRKDELILIDIARIIENSDLKHDQKVEKVSGIVMNHLEQENESIAKRYEEARKSFRENEGWLTLSGMALGAYISAVLSCLYRIHQQQAYDYALLLAK